MAIGFLVCLNPFVRGSDVRGGIVGRYRTGMKLSVAKTSIDATLLAAMTCDVRQELIPSRVEAVSQRESTKVALCLRTETGRTWLDLSWRLGTGRVCKTSNVPPRGRKEEEKNFSLGGIMRSSLVGLAMVDCRLATALERTVRLDFAERIGSEPVFSVFVELLGPGRNNLILAEVPSMEIKGCGRQVSGRKAIRSLQTGDTYSLPSPPASRLPTTSEELSDFCDQITSLRGETLSRALVRSYRGISPSVVENILGASQTSGSVLVETLSKRELEPCYTLFKRWIRAMADDNCEDFSPTLDEEDRVDVLNFRGGESSNTACELVDVFCTEEESSSEVAQLKSSCSAKLSGLMKRWKAKADLFQSQSEGLDESERLREEADMIMAAAHTWQEGSETVEYEELDGSVKSFKIPPGESAIGVARTKHKKAQKKKRAIDKVKPLLAEATQKVEYYETILFELENLGVEDMELLKELKQDIETLVATEKGIVKKKQKNSNAPLNKQKQATSHAMKQVYSFSAEDGSAVVYVGRNTRQNDLVTFQIAKKDDLWFHASGVPGSHVLLQAGPGDTVGKDEIQLAADLAAYFSRGRKESSQSVIYTRAKNVRRAGAPGLVIYENEKFIFGKPDTVVALVDSEKQAAG
ncbi:hypothetical protein NDN08_001356 [Rhodosorus marinus]|uniref:NFACT RNA-binding domain-containing protein n=1 Tax=Rhodosorus marinus TaxID=101924 RepID=A0AAV8UUQ2_9RHOD|nr:hypothetical protein NDN08_001356 [Rhodosorus marinus]